MSIGSWAALYIIVPSSIQSDNILKSILTSLCRNDNARGELYRPTLAHFCHKLRKIWTVPLGCPGDYDMKHVILLLMVIYMSICIGCEEKIVDPMQLEEDASIQQESTPAEQPQLKSMVRVHKTESVDSDAALEHWREECKSELSETRKNAAIALGDIGPAAMPLLTALLRDKDLGVRLAASSAIKKIRTGDK
jgi:hypothetical protein